jgi:hypothetical protein
MQNGKQQDILFKGNLKVKLLNPKEDRVYLNPFSNMSLLQHDFEDKDLTNQEIMECLGINANDSIQVSKARGNSINDICYHPEFVFHSVQKAGNLFWKDIVFFKFVKRDENFNHWVDNEMEEDDVDPDNETEEDNEDDDFVTTFLNLTSNTIPPKPESFKNNNPVTVIDDAIAKAIGFSNNISSGQRIRTPFGEMVILVTEDGVFAVTS